MSPRSHRRDIAPLLSRMWTSCARTAIPLGAGGPCSRSCAWKTLITACAPGCGHRIPAMPAGGSGLCSQLPVGKRWQPGSRQHTLSLWHCLFGMSCPGGRAGRVTRVPCCGHSPSCHLTALLHSPSPGSGSLVPQPSRWAAWPCPLSSRPGTEGGTRVAPWHRTVSCFSLCRGAPPRLCYPFPRTRSSRSTDAFSAGGPGSLSRRSPHPSRHGRVQLWGGSCRQGRDPPGNRGLSPQPRVCRGQREVPHTGMSWPCPCQAL